MSNGRGKHVLVLVTVAFGLLHGALAQDAERFERELLFIGGLNELGFPDYAERVLKRIEADGGADVAARAQMKVLIAQGKLDEAKARVDARSDRDSETSWRMQLELAIGYYAWQQAEKFFEIYDGFVKRFSGPVPEERREFVANELYRYVQLLMVMGQEDRAAAAMRVAFKTTPERFVQRQFAIELAELLVRLGEADPARRKALFEEASKLAKDVQWDDVDLWFGRSVVLLAHMRVVEGQREGARKLIDMYMGELTAIHQALLEQVQEGESDELLRLTPVAQCRYILGLMFYEEAKELLTKADAAADPRQAEQMKRAAQELLMGKEVQGGRSAAALQHLYNVFVQYPTTTWAVNAGQKANEVIDLLGSLGVNVRIAKVDMSAVVATQFREAKAKYMQNDFAGAIERYLEVLALFPEYPVSIDGLGDVADSSVQLGDHRMVRVVAQYLADRFGQNEATMLRAGDTLARVARAYSAAEFETEANQLNEFFFDRFPRHPQVHMLIFRRGEDYFKDEAWDKAIEYFARIVEKMPDSSNYEDALYRAALCYTHLEDTARALDHFDRFIARLVASGPRQSQIDAMFRVAEIHRKSRDLSVAAAKYHQLATLLAGPDRAKYEVTTAEKEKNDAILEGALFYRAYCASLRTDVPVRIPEGQPTDPAFWQKQYKGLALRYFEAFLQERPKSALVPAVLAQLGALYVSMEQVDKAEAALDRLQREFGGTETAMQMLFQYADTLKKMGQDRRATEVFKKMFSGEATYPPSQIFEAGRNLFGAKEYAIALEAFDNALARAQQDASLTERALLWRGKTLRELGRHAEASQAIERLFQQYPRSAYTVDAAFTLAASRAALGERATAPAERKDHFDSAYKAIRRVFQYSQDDREMRARADLELANIELRSGSKEQAMGSYMRMWVLLKAEDTAVRRHKEAAFIRGMPLLAEMNRWEELTQVAEEYMLQFPLGQHVQAAQRWQTEARVRLGGRVPQGAPLDDAAPPADDEPGEDVVPAADPGGAAAAAATTDATAPVAEVAP